MDNIGEGLPRPGNQRTSRLNYSWLPWLPAQLHYIRLFISHPVFHKKRETKIWPIFPLKGNIIISSQGGLFLLKCAWVLTFCTAVIMWHGLKCDSIHDKSHPHAYSNDGCAVAAGLSATHTFCANKTLNTGPLARLISSCLSASRCLSALWQGRDTSSWWKKTHRVICAVTLLVLRRAAKCHPNYILKYSSGGFTFRGL